MTTPLRLAYTPDPDDAFHYFALERGHLSPPAGYHFEFEHRPIQALNESCQRGEFDVCAVSSVFYPEIDADYAILASGASVGRGYGPVLACHADSRLTALAGRRVAIPGTSTTGYFLLRYFYGGFTPVPMAFDRVADAIVAREVDAGVLIHEELLNYRERPLHKVCCLGRRWYEDTALPLPVGLNVARRALGAPLLTAIENLLHDSMLYAIDHADQAMRFAATFGRGEGSAVRDEFVAKFANRDTLLMPPDVRRGLSELYARAYQRNFIDHLPQLDLIDPVAPVAARAHAP